VDNPLGGIQSFLEKFKPPFLRLPIDRKSLHPHTLVAEPHPRLAPDLYEWIDAARSHRLQQVRRLFLTNLAKSFTTVAENDEEVSWAN
jgi:hypothetical protein